MFKVQHFDINTNNAHTLPQFYFGFGCVIWCNLTNKPEENLVELQMRTAIVILENVEITNQNYHRDGIF